MKHSIATIINYCSNEFRFLEPCIAQAARFSKQILITVCDHFFDGSKENEEELYHTFFKYPSCTFLYYPYFEPGVSKKVLKRVGDNFCCTFSRLLGWAHLPQDIEYVLFLDADEVVDADKFNLWLDTFNYQKYDAVKLANYWYFRETIFRAQSYEDSVVLAKKDALSRKALLQEGDRFAAFNNVSGKTSSMAMGLDNHPFVHHFSWVRTKEEMLKKVTTWGHRNERPWKKLVEEEFSRPFTGKDFVHGYAFDTVDPFVKIDMGQVPQKADTKKFLNVKEVSTQRINKILGKGIYGLFPISPPVERS